MSFETTSERVEERKKFDPYVPEDKRKILDFEKEIGSRDIEKYCEDRALIVKNNRYPLGAIVPFYIKEYKDIKMLWSGLQELKHYREKAREKEQALSLDGLVSKMKLN